jgi:hypothetical protein
MLNQFSLLPVSIYRYSYRLVPIRTIHRIRVGATARVCLVYSPLKYFVATKLAPLTMTSASPFSLLIRHAFSPDAMLELTLPDIAHDSEKGLGSVPKEVLEKCLQPVMRGLQSFDANSLLHMKQVEHGAPLAPGYVTSHATAAGGM